MKKLLMSSMVAVLCTGAQVVYADDTHHPDQGGAPAAKAVPGKVAPAVKKSTAPRMSVDDAGCCGITNEQMDKAQERMKQAQALMVKLREAKDSAERNKLMQEHAQAMRDTMGMMRGMKMDMMGGGQGMGMMGQSKGPATTGGMMNMHQMMEERMEMMQMMMEQMLERQEMFRQDGK